VAVAIAAAAAATLAAAITAALALAATVTTIVVAIVTAVDLAVAIAKAAVTAAVVAAAASVNLASLVATAITLTQQEAEVPVDVRCQRDERQHDNQPGKKAQEGPLVTKATAVAATQQSPKEIEMGQNAFLLSEGGDDVMAKLVACSAMVGVAAMATTMQRQRQLQWRRRASGAT
jgi:hypothetical protein